MSDFSLALASIGLLGIYIGAHYLVDPKAFKASFSLKRRSAKEKK